MQSDDAILLGQSIVVSEPSPERGQRQERVRDQSARWGWLPLLPLLVFTILALIGPLVIPFSADTQDLRGRLQPPVWAGGTWDHPLGTDGLGRDVFARLAHGARLSLGVGLIAAVNAGVLGVLIGAFAGITGGWIDRAVNAIVAVSMSIPAIVIGIVVTAALGQGLFNLIVILLLGGWIVYARIARLQSIAIGRSEYVEAAYTLGAGRWHVLTQHVIPNLLPTVMVLFAQGIALVMVYEATLTYLGLGLPVESITLGSLVREGQQVLFTAWWVGLFPGLTLALAIVGFNFAADWAQSRLRVDRISIGDQA